MSVEEWINQFDEHDKDLAARLLDSVLFFSQSEITANYRSVLDSLDGWHRTKSKRKGRWFFVAMSSSAGESGDGMIYQFRLANNLDSKSFKEMFIYPRDLVRQKLTSEDKVVLIDDFSGTGKQVCDAWNSAELSFGELVAGAGKVYLVVVAATKTARDKITEETPLSVCYGHLLTDKDNVFSEKCNHYTKPEKARILHYNEKADPSNPKGFGDSGLMVVFCHRCPNNSVPFLRNQNETWTGLFPRHE